MRILLTIAFFFAIVSANFAANIAPAERQNFIAQYATLAQRESLRSNVPASIKLAQMILESDWGTSDLATEANNFFGMKVNSAWAGESFLKKDDDKNAQGVIIESKFRKYNNIEASVKDHTNHLMTCSVYAKLKNIDRADYRTWAKGLQECGYATNPAYAQKLIQIIEMYQLNTYDIPTTFTVAATTEATATTTVAPAPKKAVEKTAAQQLEEMKAQNPNLDIIFTESERAKN